MNHLFISEAVLWICALWLRLLPTRWARVAGVDVWFHLLYAEALRAQRRLPARVTRFLLEREEQRYPPLFAMLLAVLPEGAPFRWRDFISPLIDGLHLLLLFGVAGALGLSPLSCLLAGLVYAVTPTLVYEYGTLNPRSLASLILTLLMLSLMGLWTTGGLTYALLAVLLGALLLLTQKFAAQFFALTIVVSALWQRSGLTLAVGLLAPVLATFLSRGFYLEVLRSHVQILRFWRGRITELNAHAVYDSPLYARPGHGATRFYQPGLAGLARLLRGLIAHNPWILALPWLSGLAPPPPFDLFLGWAALATVAAVTVTLVPPLRFLGEGFRYLKFAAFPLSILVGDAFMEWPQMIVVLLLFGLCCFINGRLLWTRGLEVMDADFEKVIAFLKVDPRERVATLPSHRSDPLAYLAGKAVLWGGHSSGYAKLAAFYPVLTRPLPELLEAYAVPLLLVDRQYVDPLDLKLPADFRVVLDQGRYVLFER